jgi:hypothetical protein
MLKNEQHESHRGCPGKISSSRSTRGTRRVALNMMINNDERQDWDHEKQNIYVVIFDSGIL